ncbi:MAG TPA: dihydroxyacetone kinase subunit DhaL [Beutenbergiaceae bacterium]|nr:dihydroxyacetone kinase subunit DhaL [Beutenbergiaceae bacterium]
MSLGTDWALAWIREAAQVVSDNRAALIKLDREIGDGDHGENMDRGFSAVIKKLDDAAPASIADVLKLVATTLMSTVGGAAGPLYGTAFLRASKAAGQAESQNGSLDAAAVAAVLEAGLDGVVARGKAETGEKTMVDAWAPAVAAAKNIAATGGDAAEALRAAAEAARTGARATEPLIARKGRASYLGERAVGHRDPGAQSSALILDAAARMAAA